MLIAIRQSWAPPAILLTGKNFFPPVWVIKKLQVSSFTTLSTSLLFVLFISLLLLKDSLSNSIEIVAEEAVASNESELSTQNYPSR